MTCRTLRPLPGDACLRVSLTATCHTDGHCLVLGPRARTPHAHGKEDTMPTQVLVLGGGYAGVMAANRLSGSDDVAVTLVNPRPKFVERIRLHQLVGGSDDAVEPYDDVLAAGVEHGEVGVVLM